MIMYIKKSNLILGFLVIAFFAVSLFLVLDIQTPSHTKPTPITIIEIEGHRDTPIHHGGWPLGCADCHYQPIDGECTDCHIPDYWLGDDNSIYFAHHDLAYSGFMDCWSSSCHDPDPNDVRYVDTDLVEGNNWHEFCDNCHADRTHGWPKP